MPDFAVCNSSVCSVRRNCSINWASDKIKSDRPPEKQQWVASRLPDPRTHDARCPMYHPVDFEQAWKQERQHSALLQASYNEASNIAESVALTLNSLNHWDHNKRLQSLRTEWYND